MATNTWDIPTMQPAAGLLGRDFETFGFNSTWNGSGADSISASIAGRVLADKALMQQFGLTEADIQFKAGGYQGDSVIDDQFTLSDKARQALTGLTMSRTGVAGMKDGRSQVLRDAQGNVLSVGQAYRYDPAGDLKDAVIKGLGVVGAGWAAGNMLGLAGGSAAPATAAGGATAGAGEAGALSGLDAAALDAGAGAVAGGAEAAGAAGAGAGAASGGALNAAAIESLAGTAGYGANAAADLFASSVGAGASGAGVSAFDSALAAIKNVGLNAVGAVSPGAASSLASGGDWLSQTFSAITGGSGTGGSLLGGLFSGSSALRDILGLVGAGVQQYNLEKMAKDNREWASAEKAKERRRQMPVTGAGLLGNFRVIPSGAGNGG